MTAPGLLSSDTTDGSGGTTPEAASRNTTPMMTMAAPLSPQRSSAAASVANSPASLPQTTVSLTTTPLESPPSAPVLDNVISGAPMAPVLRPTGVLLGVQQLERQQEEMERRRQAPQTMIGDVGSQPQPSTSQPSSSQSQPSVTQVPSMDRPRVVDYADDDENTEPSSTITGSASDTRTGSNQVGNNQSGTNSSTFGRLIKHTRRRLSSGASNEKGRDDSNDPLEAEDLYDGALIYGYLQKLGRNGRWQTRWFETDGESLSYFKSNKRSKVLATLDLTKVGSIVVTDEDPTGCSFTIQVADRPYHLRASNKALCKYWVITLNRVKEARMQQGNVRLVSPKSQPPDLLDENETAATDYLARVVVVANRQRTRAVRAADEASLQSWEQLARTEDPTQAHAPVPNQVNYINTNNNNNNDADFEMMMEQGNSSMGSISQVVLARWKKRKTSISSLASKVLRWARSLRYASCQAENSVLLDKHVHPPGHSSVHLEGRARSIVQDGRQAAKPRPESRGQSETTGVPESVVHPVIEITSEPAAIAKSGSATNEERESRYLA